MAKDDAWMTQPLLGSGEHEMSLLGLPLPAVQNGFEAVMALLRAPGPLPDAMRHGLVDVLAAQGENEDSVFAHVTPGEVVIPRDLQTPEVMTALHKAGADLKRHTAGARGNRINPQTGAAAFYDDVEGITITGTRLLPGNDPLAGLDPSTQAEVQRRAAAVYGETASMRPQLIDPSKSITDSSNWQAGSADDLHNARTKLAAIYGTTNPRMRTTSGASAPEGPGREAWNESLQAARDSLSLHPDQSQYGFMYQRQGQNIDDPPRDAQGKPKWGPTELFSGYGPFLNNGGAPPPAIKAGEAIADGPDAYIQFYSPKK